MKDAGYFIREYCVPIIAYASLFVIILNFGMLLYIKPILFIYN